MLDERRGRYFAALQHLERARGRFIPPAHLAWVDFNRALVYHRLNLRRETIDLVEGAVENLRQSGAERELAMAYQVQELR